MEGKTMSPLPEEMQLPCGWVCKRASADELVFGHDADGFEVAATRTDESRLHPFDLTRGWELTCRRRAGEMMSERAIGRVTTRTAATEALRSCMENLSRLSRTRGSVAGLSIATIAEGVELRDEQPSATPDRPSHGGERQLLTH